MKSKFAIPRLNIRTTTGSKRIPGPGPSRTLEASEPPSPAPSRTPIRQKQVSSVKDLPKALLRAPPRAPTRAPPRAPTRAPPRRLPRRPPASPLATPRRLQPSREASSVSVVRSPTVSEVSEIEVEPQAPEQVQLVTLLSGVQLHLLEIELEADKALEEIEASETKGLLEVESVNSDEYSDEDIDTFGLDDAENDQFFRGRLVQSKRSFLANTVKKELNDLEQHRSYLDFKIGARLKELDNILERQEKSFSQFKIAFRAAVTFELNEIMTTGWSRKGHLGFIDVSNVLRPFSELQAYKSKTFILERQGIHAGEHLFGLSAIKPLPFRMRSIRRKSPCCRSSCVKSPSKSSVKAIRDEEFIDTTSSPGSSTSPYANSSFESAPETENTRRLSEDVNDETHPFASDEVTTFVRVSPVDINQEMPISLDANIECELLSSLSSGDLQNIDDTLASIKQPLSCNFGRYFYESFEKYKGKVRRRLVRHLYREKRYQKRSRNTLPCGLSPFLLKCPCSPRYPEGGLHTPTQSVQSDDYAEDVLADLLLGLEDNEESDEFDFARIFDPQQQHLFDIPGMIRSSKPPPLKGGIFTVTFDVGIPKRVPSILVEVNTESNSNRQLEIDNTGSCKCASCNWQASPLCSYIEENHEEHTGCREATVTEYWQLADDSGQPVWIYRGRKVVPLQFSQPVYA